MKTDARVRYTKKALREALLKCMEQKPINMITVKEVCEVAEMNRATFYNHYRDCYDLLEQLENDLLGQLKASMEGLSSIDTEGLVSSIFDMIDNNYDICQVLIFNKNDTSLVAKMVALAKEQSMVLWRKYLRKATVQELDMLFTCLAGGLINVIVTTYGVCEREKIIQFVNSTVKNCLSPYI